MPRKSKITAVPIDKPEGLIRAQMTGEDSWVEEPKTDAQEMSELMHEVKTEQEEKQEVAVQQDEPEPTTVTEEIKLPIAKRAPRKPKAKPEPVINVTSTPEEVIAEVEVPEAKTEQKVACPDCGKQMSAKTLKYSHAPNCVVKKNTKPEQVAERESITDEMIEQEIEKRMTNKRNERLVKRQKDLENLIAKAF